MKIEELMIYGYGKFENYRIEMGDSNLKVIYGKNEAGKSTIMSFIHSILFGFPSKQQPENRYEPKNGLAYGGYLILRKDDHSLLKIERRPGKAGGALTIEQKDGSTKGEEYLQTLLAGIDRHTYRSIFSFDIHGLQQIQKMNSDQIGKFLFLSSIYGADALFTVEQALVKQQDLLFKPNGKRPILNEVLSKLQDSHRQLMEAKRKSNEYQQLLEQKDRLEEQLQHLTAERQRYLSEQKDVAKLTSILPIVNEREWCIEQMKLLPDTSKFPEDGIKLLDQYNSTLQPLEAQLHSLNSKFEKLLHEKEELVINKKILKEVPVIQALKEQLQIYKEKVKRKHQVETKIAQLTQEIALYKQRVSPDLTDEEIISIRATVPIKESIKKLVNEHQQLKQRKKALDEQFEQIRGTLEEIEWKIKDLKMAKLPPHEREQIEKEVMKQLAVSPEQLQADYRDITSDIERRELAFKREKKQRTFLYSGLLVFLSLSSIWMLREENWILMSLLLVGVGFIGVVLMQIGSQKDPLITHLHEKHQALKKEMMLLEQHQGEDQSNLKSKLEKDNKIKETLHHELLLHKQQERNYERVLKLYEEWEKEFYQCSSKASVIAQQLTFEKDTEPEVLLEAFELVQHTQQLILKNQQHTSELDLLNFDLSHYENSAAEAMEACGLNIASVEEGIYELEKHSTAEIKKQEKLTSLNERLQEVEEAFVSIREKVNYLQNQKLQLFKKINVEDEEEFRKYAKIHQKREEFANKKMWLDKQLTTEKSGVSHSILIEKYRNNDLEKRLLELENEVLTNEKQAKQTQHELSNVLLNIQFIEQSGTYSKLRHAFENDKAIVREYAEQWVVKALAKDLLKQTIERHRNVKLPTLVAYIEEYFKKLTSNSYEHVYLPSKEQSFIVVRADGTRFLAEELSQATAEQLYLSIRLALIKSVNEQLHLPIMIDDSFVHFDNKRTENTMRLLQELKQENQVIYFTCHDHIANKFDSDDIIQLAELQHSKLD